MSDRSPSLPAELELQVELGPRYETLRLKPSRGYRGWIARWTQLSGERVEVTRTRASVLEMLEVVKHRDRELSSVGEFSFVREPEVWAARSLAPVCEGECFEDGCEDDVEMMRMLK